MRLLERGENQDRNDKRRREREKKREKRGKKKRRIWLTDKFYFYKEMGQYLRQKLGTDKGCVDYRIKDIKSGRKLLICIRKKPGPRGGKTKAVALLRSFRVRSTKDKRALRLLRKAVKLAREVRGGKLFPG